jgi:hypothetical protein
VTLRQKVAESLLLPIYAKLAYLRAEEFWRRGGVKVKASFCHLLLMKAANSIMCLADREYELYWRSGRWQRFADFLLGIKPPWHRYESDADWYIGRVATPEENRRSIREATARDAQRRLAEERAERQEWRIQ